MSLYWCSHVMHHRVYPPIPPLLVRISLLILYYFDEWIVASNMIYVFGSLRLNLIIFWIWKGKWVLWSDKNDEWLVMTAATTLFLKIEEILLKKLWVLNSTKMQRSPPSLAIELVLFHMSPHLWNLPFLNSVGVRVKVVLHHL